MTPLETELQQHLGLLSAAYGLIVGLGLPCAFLLRWRWRRDPVDWTLAFRRLQWRPWTAGEALGLGLWLAACHAAAARAGGPLVRLAAETGLSLNGLALFLQSMAFHGAGLVGVAALLLFRRRGLDPAFGARARRVGADVLTGTVYFLAVMPPLLLGALLYNLLLQALGQSFSLQDVATAMADERNPWMRAGFVAVAVALAPLFEEVLFRGIGLVLLARRLGPAAAVCAVSAVFALIHFHLPAVAPLFLLSTALCLAYVRTGSLLVPVVMHAWFNGVTVFILLSAS